MTVLSLSDMVDSLLLGAVDFSNEVIEKLELLPSIRDRILRINNLNDFIHWWLMVSNFGLSMGGDRRFLWNRLWG